jgi:predicted enzyme related to lactoylglutathione lyase
MRTLRLSPVIVFVREFERCVTFYRSVFGLEPVTRDDKWAEFEIGDIRFALHGGYDGDAHPGRPVALHFVVDDIGEAVERIQRGGGTVSERPRRFTFASEGKQGWEVAFKDPSGNEFEVQQVLEPGA